jgi:hypothetical protein
MRQGRRGAPRRRGKRLKARIDSAQKNPGVLAACIEAWALGGDEMDASAGIAVVAETIFYARRFFMKG